MTIPETKSKKLSKLKLLLYRGHNKIKQTDNKTNEQNKKIKGKKKKTYTHTKNGNRC